EFVFIRDFKASGQKIFSGGGEYRFQQPCIRVVLGGGVVVPSPNGAGRPRPSVEPDARVVDRRGGPNHVALFRRFGFGQTAGGELRGPVFRGKQGETSGIGIHAAPVDVPAIFIGLAAV